MGLDIRYFEKVERIGDLADDYPEGQTNLRDAPGYAVRMDGLEPGLYAVSGERGHFRAGSYSGYGEWRDKLAKLMLGMAAHQVWDSLKEGCGLPFYELIAMSDCEGTIGPKTCAKLADDFVKNAHRISEADEYFQTKYREWRHSFHIAANGGAVVFS